jgi:hypothetical protein
MRIIFSSKCFACFSRHISGADVQGREGKKYMHDVINHQIKISCNFSPWAMCATLSLRVSTRHQLFSVHSLHKESRDAGESLLQI